MIRDRVLLNSFLISLCLHLFLLFFAVRLTPGSPRDELIILEMVEMKEEPVLVQGKGNQGTGEPSSEKAPSQDILWTYMDRVKHQIARNREYPRSAKKKGIEGKVSVGFTIKADGGLKETKIIHSSGHQILDETAVTTIEKSDPFPVFPKEIINDEIDMTLTIAYRLQGAEFDNTR